MKPANKYERHIDELAATLPPLTSAQHRYAEEHCHDHYAVRRKGMYYCLDCGASWPAPKKATLAEEAPAKIKCPSCGHVLTTEKTRKQSWYQESSFQVITTAGECQVVRSYETSKFFSLGEAAKFHINEVVQVFINPDRRRADVVRARPLNYSFGSYSFSYTRDLSIKGRNPYGSYGDNSYAYYFTAQAVYPHRKVLPVLKRNGYSKAVYDLSTYGPIRGLLFNPKYETLVKAGRIDMLRVMSDTDINDYWSQIKIANRHNYFPCDVKIWKDTLSMADQLHLDVYSPKYVCPDNLMQLHDQLARTHREKMEREEAARRARNEREEAARAKSENEQYEREHGMLLAVMIHENDLTITPLKNKLEFIDEGKAMHHCVATYWGRKDCLILSVRSGEKRLATVELSMKDFSVKQCRANSNQVPERYNEILSILEHHRCDFAKAIAEGYKKVDAA